MHKRFAYLVIMFLAVAGPAFAQTNLLLSSQMPAAANTTLPPANWTQHAASGVLACGQTASIGYDGRSKGQDNTTSKVAISTTANTDQYIYQVVSGLDNTRTYIAGAYFCSGDTAVGLNGRVYYYNGTWTPTGGEVLLAALGANNGADNGYYPVYGTFTPSGSTVTIILRLTNGSSGQAIAVDDAFLFDADDPLIDLNSWVDNMNGTYNGPANYKTPPSTTNIPGRKFWMPWRGLWNGGISWTFSSGSGGAEVGSVNYSIQTGTKSGSAGNVGGMYTDFITFHVSSGWQAQCYMNTAGGALATGAWFEVHAQPNQINGRGDGGTNMAGGTAFASYTGGQNSGGWSLKTSPMITSTDNGYIRLWTKTGSGSLGTPFTVWTDYWTLTDTLPVSDWMLY